GSPDRRDASQRRPVPPNAPEIAFAPRAGVRSPGMGWAIVLASSVALLGVAGWTLAGAFGIRSLALRILAAYTLGWTVLVVSTAVLSIPGWLSRGSLFLLLMAAAGASLAARALLERVPFPSAGGAVHEALADP